MMDNLWEKHEAEQEKEANVYPVCNCCGDYIFDDFIYCIDGEILCTDCLNDQYRRYTEDFMK